MLRLITTLTCDHKTTEVEIRNNHVYCTRRHFEDGEEQYRIGVELLINFNGKPREIYRLNSEQWRFKDDRSWEGYTHKSVVAALKQDPPIKHLGRHIGYVNASRPERDNQAGAGISAFSDAIGAPEWIMEELFPQDFIDGVENGTFDPTDEVGVEMFRFLTEVQNSGAWSFGGAL